MRLNRNRARLRRRRGVAAVELALSLPMILTMLLGLWEMGRVVQVQGILLNAVREGSRQAATGQYTNAQVQAMTLFYLKMALNDTSGTLTQNAVVSVSDLTTAGADATAANSLDQLQVTVTIPFKDVRWINLSLVTTSTTVLSNQAICYSMKDATYPLTTPQPPTG